MFYNDCYSSWASDYIDMCGDDYETYQKMVAEAYDNDFDDEEPSFYTSAYQGYRRDW